MTNNNLEIFCRQIRDRSDEHRQAVELLHPAQLSSQIIPVLRQELDSMVRVIYLLSISDLSKRNELIKASVEGDIWKIKTKNNKYKKVTDREMVELANHLQGWTKSVYRFGCAFIHLSSFHDYKQREPMNMISGDEQRAILQHMQYYHDGPHTNQPNFDDLVPYLLSVFNKIASNLKIYIRDLQEGKIIKIDTVDAS